jgi:hypothetical protein
VAKIIVSLGNLNLIFTETGGTCPRPTAPPKLVQLQRENKIVLCKFIYSFIQPLI